MSIFQSNSRYLKYAALGTAVQRLDPELAVALAGPEALLDQSFDGSSGPIRWHS